MISDNLLINTCAFQCMYNSKPNRSWVFSGIACYDNGGRVIMFMMRFTNFTVMKCKGNKSLEGRCR